jgi:uncharacterized protein (DUF302 family)
MGNGISSIESAYPFDETVEKLEAVLREKGIKLFTVVDHSGEAASVGLTMPPTKLLIFGNPKAGTPVMLSAPSAALDLPLKILVAEDSSGTTSLSWNDPEYLQARHGFAAELKSNLAAAGALVSSLARAKA